MSDTMERRPELDDGPSASAITLIGLLASLAALLLVAVVVAVGWGAGGDHPENDSRSATAGLPDLGQELAAQLWVLDASDSSVRTNDENPVSLAFDDGRISGLAPCNAYWGRFSLDEDDQSLRITDLRHTSRECPAITMRAEREYLAALRSVRDIDLDDRDHLVLTNDVGDRLSFDAYDARDELVGTWRIRQVGGTGELDVPVDGTTPVLVFHDADSDLAVATGCNTLRSSWALVGDRLETEPAAQTLKHCEEPDGVQRQETTLAEIMGEGTRVHVAPGRLVVLDRLHRILAVATQPE